MANDNVQASQNTTAGAIFRTFSDSTNEWPASITCYVSGGSAGAWTLQQVDLTHGLPVSVLGTSTTTIAGSVAVTGIFWQTTQPVSIAAAITANQGGTWNVGITGTPTVSLGSSTVNVTVEGTVPISAVSLPLPANAAQETGGNLATLVGGITGSVYQDNLKQVGGNAVAVGSGATTTGTQRVTIATDDTVTVTGNTTTSVSGMVTVSGTVTANAGTNLNTSLLALESGGNLATLAGGVTSSVYQENLKQVGGSAFTLGQQLAAASLPVVLTAAQITTLTPLATVAVTQSTTPWVGNTTQLGGVAIALGSGTTTTGTQRVVVASDDTINASLGSSTLNVAIVSGGGSGGTASNFGSAFPSTGTAIGVSDTAGNMGRLNIDGSGFLKVNVAAGSGGNGAASNTGSAVPAQADYAGLNVGGTLRGQTGTNPTGSIYASQTDLTSVGGTTIGIGQQVAGASLPVVLPASQITTLTPLSSVTATINGTPTVSLGSASPPFNLVQVAGSAISTGHGTAAGSIRVELPTDGTGGLATVTTVTTVAAVTAITNALPTGSNIIGVVGINPAANTVSLGSASPPFNIVQVAGAAVSTGHGTAAGSLRVELPTDGTGVIAGITNAVTVSQATAASLNATVIGTGTFAVQTTGSESITASTANGYTPFQFTASSASTFAVKSSAGNLASLYLSNGTASPAFFHIYNTGTPTLGSGTASLNLFVPAGGGSNIPILPPGITFTPGIGITVSGSSLLSSDTVTINSSSIGASGAFL